MYSNLIFGSFGYRSVAIFCVHAAERKAMLLKLWKDLRSVEKVVILALWSCASLHPRALPWSCTQFLSWCLVCWAGSERFASARFQLRSRQQCGRFGHLSLDLIELCLAWEAWKFVSDVDLENLRCNAGSNTQFAVLALCTHSSWWLLFETNFGKLFSVPRTFGFVFRDQSDKSFQTR